MQTLVQKHHEDIVGQIDKAFTNLQGKVLSICPRRKNWPETNLIKRFWPWSPLSDEPLPWGGLRQHWSPSPKMYTFMVLAGADTTLEKPATVKTKSCRSPVSLACGRASDDRVINTGKTKPSVFFILNSYQAQKNCLSPFFLEDRWDISAES